MDQRVDIVNHPGDTLGLAGFFLDNTVLGMRAQIMGLDDQSVKYMTDLCVRHSSIFVTCQIPALISYFGYYVVSLYEEGTLYKLNDENVIQIIILPLPVIAETQKDTYVTTGSDSNVTSQVYITHFKVRLQDGFNGEYLEHYKLKYLRDVVCRVGSRLLWVTTNSTWHSPDEVTCTLRNFYNWRPECIELSINGGRSYSRDCMSAINTIRAPIAYSYSPQ
jgi:hypothetical protein